MKTIENKELKVKGAQKPLMYFDMIDSCVRRPPQGGFKDLKDMQTRFNIMNKIELAKKNEKALELEDAEFDVMHDSCQPKNFPWAIVEAFTFLTDIEAMKGQ